MADILLLRDLVCRGHLVMVLRSDIFAQRQVSAILYVGTHYGNGRVGGMYQGGAQVERGMRGMLCVPRHKACGVDILLLMSAYWDH